MSLGDTGEIENLLREAHEQKKNCFSLLPKEGNPEVVGTTMFFMEMDSMGHQESETAGCLIVYVEQFFN